MLLQRFLTCRRAGALPFFALSAIPITGLIGAAVDYGRANAVRASMQTAVDSTALAMSKEAATVSAAQLQADTSNYFNALFTRPDARGVSITTTYTSNNGSQLVIKASGTVKTTLMNLMGVSDLTVGATGTAVWGNTKLRVALVLDNTGSMSQKDGTGTSKISALKTASHNFLTQLQNAAAKDGDVYVSIIPFGKDVDVGTSNYAAPWIDWTDWDTANGTCSDTRYNSQSSCIAHSKVWTPASHSTWNGCVTDRDQNYDTLNTVPSSGGTLFPAEQYSSCPTTLMALSYDWTALNNKIDAMTPNGNTNQAIGLVWGWQSLTQGSPLDAPAEDANYKYQKVIILLSDGLNTQDRWYSDASPIDTRQQIACNNIKAAGITIYTVLVMSGNSTVLQNCASDSTKYFALTSAQEIITTFDQIGTNLSKLRLAR